MKKAEKWQKDLEVYQNINTTFIVEGNVHDFQPWIHDDDSCEPVKLSKFLHRYLSGQGYTDIVFYNRIDGFSNPYDNGMVKDFFRITDSDADASRPIGKAVGLIRRFLGDDTRPSAVIIDMANTIATSPDSLSEEELQCFSSLMLTSGSQTYSYNAVIGQSLTNLLFLVTEKVNDIPAWFYLGNPYVRTLTVTRPGRQVRSLVIDEQLDVLRGVETLPSPERDKIRDSFVSLTDGMTLVEIFGVFTLCQKKDFDVFHIRDAIKLLRYGETESHWDKIGPEKMRGVEAFLSARVKGQPYAVARTADVLRRAFQGMSGMQGGSGSRPKGILFFAGPTGTGKTRLAKTIAEFVFGDASFLTRFDMSEYQQPHSDQKLLGAPPGYIGYSDGGQLTNALRQKPFCVLLFDEIEKAHPSILDKFLQILEDGRLTDSAGETVYFSESLIIFTSNLCVTDRDESTGKNIDLISPGMSYGQIRTTLLENIRRYFKYTIRRPELLNRIGDNFVIFDFIREQSAAEILELELSVVKGNMEREKGVKLTFGDRFKDYLLEIILRDLSNGGRGVSNVVESFVLNPLSGVLTEESCGPDDEIVIEDGPPGGEGVFRYRVARDEKK